jgi:hypothetical protein
MSTANKGGGETPSPFSKINPRLQLAIDASSLWLAILEGWRSSTVDLEFGSLYHGALEAGDHARLAGASREEAQLVSLKWVLEHSGRRDLETQVCCRGEEGPCTTMENFTDLMDPDTPAGKLPEGCTGPHGVFIPWGGEYVNRWRCTHTVGSKVALAMGTANPEYVKGGAKKGRKCPFAHSGVWSIPPAPNLCGECGSPVETQVIWLPGKKAKCRYTLVRAVIWYWEEQPEKMEDGVAPYRFADGTDAVELSFQVPLGVTAYTGEEYILCGHMDGLATFGPETFTRERKTTGSALSRRYFDGFSPNIQIDVYDLVGQLLYSKLNLKGVLLEACSTTVGGAKFGTKPLYRGAGVREEFYRELTEYWIPRLEEFAKSGEYPKSREKCGWCDFNGICSKEPGARETWLKADFEKSHWNPLEVR